MLSTLYQLSRSLLLWPLSSCIQLSKLWSHRFQLACSAGISIYLLNLYSLDFSRSHRYQNSTMILENGKMGAVIKLPYWQAVHISRSWLRKWKKRRKGPVPNKSVKMLWVLQARNSGTLLKQVSVKVKKERMVIERMLCQEKERKRKFQIEKKKAVLAKDTDEDSKPCLYCSGL